MIVKEQNPDFYNISGLVFIPAYDREEDIYRDLKGNVLPTVPQILMPLLTSSVYAQRIETEVHKLIEGHLKGEPYGKPFTLKALRNFSTPIEIGRPNVSES